MTIAIRFKFPIFLNAQLKIFEGSFGHSCAVISVCLVKFCCILQQMFHIQQQCIYSLLKFLITHSIFLHIDCISRPCRYHCIMIFNILTVQVHVGADWACVHGQEFCLPALPTVNQRPVHSGCLAPEPPPDPRIRKQGLTAGLDI